MIVGKVTGLNEDRQFDLDDYDSIEFEFKNGGKLYIYYEVDKQRLRVATAGVHMPNLLIMPGGGTNSAYIYVAEERDLNSDGPRTSRDKKPEDKS